MTDGLIVLCSMWQGMRILIENRSIATVFSFSFCSVDFVVATVFACSALQVLSISNIERIVFLAVIEDPDPTSDICMHAWQRGPDSLPSSV